MELPTIENMCKVFYEDLQRELLKEDVSLVELELGDSPLATYSIGSRLLTGSTYQQISDEKFLEYEKKHGKTDTRLELYKDRGNTSTCEAVFCYWDSL